MKNARTLRPNRRSAVLTAVVAACSISLAQMMPAQAQDESSTGYYSDGYRPITNDGFMNLAKQSPETNLFRAEMAINREQWGLAVKYLRKSMHGNDDDIDTHKFLAICLEKQMDASGERDDQMYKECVNEWLIVLRNLKGPEKGLNFKNGLSFRNNKKWEDEEGGIMARQHLIQLCGSVPGKFETNNKFISRVTKEHEEHVQATVLSKKPPALQSGIDQ